MTPMKTGGGVAAVCSLPFRPAQMAVATPVLLSLSSSPNFPRNSSSAAVLHPTLRLTFCTTRRQLAPPPAAAPLRVVFTGGGTSGHTYPAIAIAEALRDACPDAEILFVGSNSGPEATAAPAAGFSLITVPRALPARSLISPSNLLVPLRFLRAVVASLGILRRFRPTLVVGTGGFVAAPVYLAAVLSGAKIVIQEQNSQPGLVNRLAAPFAERIFVAFNGCVKYLDRKKCLVYGNPVRIGMRRYVSKAVARSHFFPTAGSKHREEDAQVVLVLGGSSGAQAVNIAVLSMYYEMLLRHKNRFIIWQTGDAGFTEMESLVKINRRLFLTPYLHEMDMAYAAADVVVSRAGAMTCTEILATGKPSILIPLANASDDHQTKNAYIMADVAGSKVLTEDELDSSSLEEVIDGILGNESLRADMSERALSAARPEAAANIAQCILSIVNSTAATK